jgi:hypothetical protein
MNEVDRYMIRISSIYETDGFWEVTFLKWRFSMGKEIDFSEAISNLACIFQRLQRTSTLGVLGESTA